MPNGFCGSFSTGASKATTSSPVSPIETTWLARNGPDPGVTSTPNSPGVDRLGAPSAVAQAPVGVLDGRARHAGGLRDLADRRQPVAAAQATVLDRAPVVDGDLLGQRLGGLAVEGIGHQAGHGLALCSSQCVPVNRAILS